MLDLKARAGPYLELTARWAELQSTFDTLLDLILTATSGGSTVFIPGLGLRKPRHRKVK